MVRFGIVGAGGIAKKFISDLKWVEHAELTAVSARTPEKASAYKKKYHAKYSFPTYEAMAKSDVIDAAYIATPHNFHFEQAILFMKNKKHVIIEKPIAVNALQYEEMMRVAKENNVVMMEAMWTYFLPATQWLTRVVKNNILGKLLKVHIVFGFPLTIGKSKEGRLLNPDLAGGGLLDLGVYPLNYYLLLKQGEIKSFNAKADFTKTGVDSAGVIGIIDDHKTEYILKYSLNKILGDKATLKFENGEVIMKNFHGCQEVILNGHSIPIPYEGEGFTHEIRSFVNTIENNESENDILPMSHSKESMLLLDKVRRQINLKYPFE
jgi:predicted dehydrogenase